MNTTLMEEWTCGVKQPRKTASEKPREGETDMSYQTFDNVQSDAVHHPDHYAGHGVECKDAMASAMYGADVSNIGAYWWGCAFKYLFRFPRKGGRQDLEKAKQCIDFLIEEEYGK